MTPCDPWFPQVGVALDTEAMRRLLQIRLFPKSSAGNRCRVESCRVGEMRHKPGKRFVLTYLLGLRRPGEVRLREQTVYARLLPAAGGQAAAPGNAIYLPQVPMQLWLFPADPTLDSLQRMLDRAYLTPYLGGLLGDGCAEIRTVDPEVVHYLPERSCMIRYRVDFAATQDNAEPPPAKVLYGKHYHDHGGSDTFRIMRQLSEQAPCFAEPLHYDAESRVLWQPRLPGKTLAWSELCAPAHEHRVGRLATTVAVLHRCRIGTPARYGVDDIVRDLHKTVATAAQVRPQLAGELRAGVAVLLDGAQTLDFNDSHLAPMHLDLKLCNFLIDGNDFAVIDMDSLRLGDPLADVGSLLANFYLNGIRAGQDFRQVEPLVDAFIRAYAEQVPWAADIPRLRWYIAAALIHEVVRRGLRQNDSVRIGLCGDFLAISRRYEQLCREALVDA